MGGHGEALEVAGRPQGPVKARSCTDILCLGLFLACLAGWAGVAVIGFQHGKPEQLIYPTNSLGEVCGRGDNEAKPSLFFHDLMKCLNLAALVDGCHTPQVCVEACPDKTTSLWAYATAKDLAPGIPSGFDSFDLDFQRQLCIASLTDEEWEDATNADDGDLLKLLIDQRKCPAYTLESSPIGGRCVPDFGLIDESTDNTTTMEDADGNPISNKEDGEINAGNVWDAIKAIVEILNLQGFAERVFSDLVKAKWMLLAGVGISLGVSFLWIFLMRFMAGDMVWLSLILVIGLLGLSSAYCWVKYSAMAGDDSAAGSVFDVNPITQDMSVYLQLRDTWLAFFIISVVLLCVILLVTLFLRKRIRIAVELIGESSKAVGSIMSSVFYPILSFLLQLVVMAWFVLVLTFLASSSEKEGVVTQNMTATGTVCPTLNQTCSPESWDASVDGGDGCVCTFIRLGKNSLANYFQLYNLFMLFWSLCFVTAMGEMVLAGAFSSWYWTLHKSDLPSLPLLGSFGRTLRYHTGTLAFGSLIIAIIKMIRLMLQWIQDKLEEQGADNPLVKAILCLCKCCFWCLEKFMKFINRNAYILTSVEGTNFCRSAKEAFSLIMRNMVRAAVLDKVTDFLLFLGKMVVTATVALLAFFYFSGGIDEEVPSILSKPDLNYYLVPVILLTLCTYSIASCFFSVYAMAVDTLFLCFLVDLERNDGSAEKPYYMSNSLKKILDLKNKAKYAK